MQINITPHAITRCHAAREMDKEEETMGAVRAADWRPGKQLRWEGNWAIIDAKGTKFESSAFGRIPLVPARTWLPVFGAGTARVGGELASAICHRNDPKGRVRPFLARPTSMPR